jgi:thioredoxin-dependent peroxiredoxin
MATAAFRVGDETPDFVRTAADGQQIRLSDYRGRQAVVLYFYPRDNTKICTNQACEFRDRHDDFSAAGAAVIGVSANSLESHRQFAERYQLPFHLVSDADGSLRQLFRVPNRLLLIPQRTTFVIDKQGTIQLVYSALWQDRAHIRRALKTLEDLRCRQPLPSAPLRSAKTPQR